MNAWASRNPCNWLGGSPAADPVECTQKSRRYMQRRQGSCRNRATERTTCLSRPLLAEGFCLVSKFHIRYKDFMRKPKNAYGIFIDPVFRIPPVEVTGQSETLMDFGVNCNGDGRDCQLEGGRFRGESR